MLTCTACPPLTSQRFRGDKLSVNVCAQDTLATSEVEKQVGPFVLCENGSIRDVYCIQPIRSAC